MRLLEGYQELVERDSAEISYFWKLTQIFLYLLCTISGYVCSCLFYLIWHYIYGETCPLWAQTGLILDVEQNHVVSECTSTFNQKKLWKCIIVTHEYDYKCKIYLATCFSSSIFGFVWLTFFIMCGKGGYDPAIYEASWRIVFPATFFNLLFSILATYETIELRGYHHFITDLRHDFLKLSKFVEIMEAKSECEIMQTYVELYNIHEYDVCKIFTWLQIFSRIMMCSWIGGLVMLILRIVVSLDFKILNVKIYEVPENHSLITLGNNVNDNAEMNHKISKEKED